MAVFQPLLDLVELCSQHGLSHAVISPGSRSAALTLAFARHPIIQTYVLPDERAAGYFALGLSQSLREPVALVCTSGTAALNFGPAVAEAFFLQVPLLVLTADRPKEWINQQDGQTIFQSNLYGPHVQYFAEIPQEFTHLDAKWFVNRIINRSFNHLVGKQLGPVHLNIPIREPFYPNKAERYEFDPSVRKILRTHTTESLLAESWSELLAEMEGASRILIAGGQQAKDAALGQALTALQTDFCIPVVGDVISNLCLEEPCISGQDLFLNGLGEVELESLQPELLITFGNSFISKNLKLFFRHHRPTFHWHVSTGEELIDPFQSVTRIIPLEATGFFRQLVEELEMKLFREGEDSFIDEAFLNAWQRAETSARRWIDTFLPDQPFNEFSALQRVVEQLPEVGQLHLANSMAVRYVNLIGLRRKQLDVFANRGTSGIDGCLSTAVGAAAGTAQPVFIAIGDVAFFYDRNALWHPHVGPNLRIILLNNGGGGIFRMIEGPRELPERETFFETPHYITAERTAQDANLDYFRCTTWDELTQQLSVFLAPTGRSKLLEITTDMAINEAVFKAFKSWR